MFCPKCGYEFQKGYRKCSKCDEFLVENIDEEMKYYNRFSLFNKLRPQIDSLKKFAYKALQNNIVKCLLMGILCLLYTLVVFSFEFNTLIDIYLTFFLFGAVFFIISLNNKWKNLYILPLAWLTNIIYAFIVSYFFYTGGGFISFGWDFMFILWITYILVPNILYTLLLAIIHQIIRKNIMKKAINKTNY